ncbi:hypothetical protein HEB94_009314 [Actinopolymorpha pittospori]|uniref:Uncharacterized protein n=1 Tax=Actinopolymorpha pittospori TaxID=648752 RepID=A0A927RPT9_9ACTN|nr:hypothetical protein [Actinopolymorpha pittospori]
MDDMGNGGRGRAPRWTRLGSPALEEVNSGSQDTEFRVATEFR